MLQARAGRGAAQQRRGAQNASDLRMQNLRQSLARLQVQACFIGFKQDIQVNVNLHLFCFMMRASFGTLLSAIYAEKGFVFDLQRSFLLQLPSQELR